MGTQVFNTLSPDQQEEIRSRTRKLHKLNPYFEPMRECGDESFIREIYENSLKRYHAANRLFFPALSRSGLHIGHDIDCVTSRYFFIGGTGKIWCPDNPSAPQEAIHWGKYLIRDIGTSWRIEYLNDKPVSIDYVDFSDALKAVIDYYDEIGALPFSQGLKALLVAGIWLLHSFPEPSHQLKLIGGTNYDYRDEKLTIEHEFSITQDGSIYIVDKLDGEAAKLQFNSIDEAASAVLRNYDEKNSPSMAHSHWNRFIPA